MYFVCTASCTTSQPQDGDHIKDDGESIIDQSCLQWWKSQNRTWYQTTSAATPLSLKEKKSTPCFMCGGYSCQTITQNNGGDDGIDVCVIFLGSSWVLLLVVQGAVVAVASTPRATQSSARLRRRGSRLLACLQPAGGKAKSECAAGFCLGEAFLLQASLLSSESVITGQGVGGLRSIHYKSWDVFMLALKLCSGVFIELKNLKFCHQSARVRKRKSFQCVVWKTFVWPFSSDKCNQLCFWCP